MIRSSLSTRIPTARPEAGSVGTGSRRHAATAAAGASTHTQGGNAPLFDGGKVQEAIDAQMRCGKVSRISLILPHFMTHTLANRLRGLAQRNQTC